jgi:hypothetical protein
MPKYVGGHELCSSTGQVLLDVQGAYLQQRINEKDMAALICGEVAKQKGPLTCGPSVVELPGIETDALPASLHPELQFRYFPFPFSPARYLRFRFRVLTASRAGSSRCLPHGASLTWPRGGGWAGGGASCPGAGPSCPGAGPSCPGAGPCGCGAGPRGCGGDSGWSARGGGAATDGTSGFAVGGGTSGGGSGVISPMGAGLISAASTVPCSLDTDRPCP